jgi:hypothetical protein
MVDIKREDITLSDWTKGISADEFAWGSYFYSDAIQSGYSTKWFKLWPKKEVYNLNERTQWYPIALCPCNWSMLADTPSFIAFTKDRTLEMGGTLNWSTRGEGWDAWGWAIYQEGTAVNWLWGFVYSDYALVFTETTAKKIAFKDTYDIEYWQTITNPRFENSASGWTVGSGWTLTDDWMEHETGETWTLEVTAPCAWDGYGRFAVKITNCTAWNITLHQSKTNTNAIVSEAWRNGWFVGTANGMVDEENNTLTITPSSDFDWTIEAVNFHVYKSASVSTISWITAADKHMAIERWGDIYITSWNTIDILSTIDWTVSDSKELCRKDEEIVAITQQGDSLIIRATDWIDSRQYYWNWIDSVASECIRWQGQVIRWATGTETLSYVLAWTWANTSWNAYRLYSVSGYQRSLIASNAYKVQPASWNLEHFHPSKKFAFNDVQWPESMCVCLDNLYIPWCDGIYRFWQIIPWLWNAWSRPIRYENGADRLFLIGDGGIPLFTYRLNQRQYYVEIKEDQYTDKWFLVTDSIYRDKLGTRKAIEKMKLGYKSLPSTAWNIKIYAIVDDDYFWRFDVTNVTDRPKVWDVYTVAANTNAEIISINKTATKRWEITFRTISNGGSLTRANRYLAKVSGDGDATIDTNNNYDNMCLIKTIETEQQEFGSDLVFWKDFVNSYMPYRHKLQLVIEITKKNVSGNDYRTPEIYELSMVSDITDVTL